MKAGQEMLSEAERDRIRGSLGTSGGKAAISDALMAIQESRGWVSDEAIGEVAEALGVGCAEVEGVATFFELVFRRKVGRHVILLCDSVSCWVMGYEQVVQQLYDRLNIGLGETTADGRFTLLPVVCLGACDRAPAVMIDNDLHGELDTKKIDEVLAGYK